MKSYLDVDIRVLFESYSDALQIELNKFGIKVAVIEPGGFTSEIYEKGRNFFNSNYGIDIENFSDTLYKDELKMLYKWTFQAEKERPYPTPVAKAIFHAIHAKSPKVRYLPYGNKKEGIDVLNNILNYLVVVNFGMEEELSLEDLQKSLKRSYRKIMRLPQYKN